MAEAAAAAGIHYMDLGKGDEEYKRSLMTGELIVAEGWVDRLLSARTLARRFQQAPRRFVVGHPPLARAVRGVLKQLATMRRST